MYAIMHMDMTRNTTNEKLDKLPRSSSTSQSTLPIAIVCRKSYTQLFYQSMKTKLGDLTIADLFLLLSFPRGKGRPFRDAFAGLSPPWLKGLISMVVPKTCTHPD